MNILFKYATRARPKLFRDVLERYRDFFSLKHNCRFVISVDEDDESMANPGMRSFLEMEAAKGDFKFHFLPPGQTKISAVNAGLEGEDFDVLFCMSDDMIPIERGFDDIIATDMLANFPDLDGMLWYFDGRNNRVCTLSIIGRKYFESRGRNIYRPEYFSLYADTEETHLAMASRKMIRFSRVIVTHAWTEITGTDTLHQKNQTFLDADRATFERRKAAGFPL